MRFPRAIRLDRSDLNVFETAAEPGEWAVPGGFVFSNVDPQDLAGKARQAFVHGFLGTESFGWTTLVEVAEIDEADHERVAVRLAEHFVARFGAPDRAAAMPVARDEMAFAAGLCDHKLHTLLAVEREMTDKGIAERFKVIEPERGGGHAKIWSIVEE